MFPFYTHWKTPENLWFSGVFSGYKVGTLAENRLKSCLEPFEHLGVIILVWFLLFYGEMETFNHLVVSQRFMYSKDFENLILHILQTVTARSMNFLI